MSSQGQRLFDLLPSVYRVKDAQLSLLTPSDAAQLLLLQSTAASALTADQLQQLSQLEAKSRGPLQSLLMLIEEQLAILAEDLDQLYDDQFIETCAPWVIPYIGDLIGYQPVHGLAAAVASPRAEVAHTISFRRRKGTVLVLEQLARDVTGWGAHAIEFFKLLAVAQSMKNIRPDNLYSPDLRNWKAGGYMDTGFDATAHKIDVRRIAVQRGRYNIQNIGIFLWSLNAYSLTKVPATAVDASGLFFRFSPLGADMPLFNNPVSQGPDVTQAALPLNVPARLRRRVLCQDIQNGAGAVYYGENKSLALYLNGTLLSPYQIRVCDLSGEDGAWGNLAGAGSLIAASVDPQLGRIALTSAISPLPSAGAPAPQLQASFCYGFNADMGGGEYSRVDSFAVPPEGLVFPFPDKPVPPNLPRYSTLQDALTFATTVSGEAQVAVEIGDSSVYQLNSADSPGLQIDVPAGVTLELRAADGCRPTLALGGEITVSGGAGSSLNLNGLLIAYAPASAGAPTPTALVHVPNVSTNQLSQLGLNHCTVVPGLALAVPGSAITQGSPQFGGRPTLVAELPSVQVVIQNSVVGAMQVHQLATANLLNSIVDACEPTLVAYAALDGNSGGGSLTMQGCTVVGKIHATLLDLVSDSIVWAGLVQNDTWAAPLWADRKQQGCVRFSYLPAGAVVPRQFECVEQGDGIPPPLFYSLRYGDPGYGKLWPSTDDSIRRGAEDGGEMGAFQFVLAPLRETDLLTRLQEYLPVGLEFGIFYQT
jgi:hypothetical protein